MKPWKYYLLLLSWSLIDLEFAVWDNSCLSEWIISSALQFLHAMKRAVISEKGALAFCDSVHKGWMDGPSLLEKGGVSCPEWFVWIRWKHEDGNSSAECMGLISAKNSAAPKESGLYSVNPVPRLCVFSVLQQDALLISSLKDNL